MTLERSRQEIARSRAGLARKAWTQCDFCSQKCGVNRQAGEIGPCRAGAFARWCGAQLESGEEAELCPCYAITLSGCDLRCGFCITGETSWNARAGERMNPVEVAAGAQRALLSGARTIQVLGGEPTIHLPSVLELVASLPENAHLVYKTNGCCTESARSLLEGLFDTWVIDYKFGSDHCAKRLARACDYIRAVRQTLHWAERHTHLIVRHLLMPGHVDCCWKPVARWLSREMREVAVSLRGGFWPAWKSHRFPEMKSPCSEAEIESAIAFANTVGLHLVPTGIQSATSGSRDRSQGELLVLPDGRLLAHHASPELAKVLQLFIPGVVMSEQKTRAL